MINICIQEGQEWQEILAGVLAEVEKEPEGRGRVTLHISDTGPVVRVMVEAKQANWAKKGAERIATTIQGSKK